MTVTRREALVALGAVAVAPLAPVGNPVEDLGEFHSCVGLYDATTGIQQVWVDGVLVIEGVPLSAPDVYWEFELDAGRYER